MDDSGLLVAAATYLFLMSIWISIVDWRKLVIPNALNAVNAATGLGFAGVLKSATIASCIAGGVLGFVTLLAFAIGYRRARGADGVGLGDVKFMAGAGLWVGWEGIAPLLLVASASALAFQLIRGIRGGGLDWQQRLAFGPFLSLGMVIVWTLQVTGSAPWKMPP